jgi:hypothetical protein
MQRRRTGYLNVDHWANHCAFDEKFLPMSKPLVVDVSFPDDIFCVHIRVELLHANIYQLSYESDDRFIGLLETAPQVSACKLTGKTMLSEFQLKMIHEAITGKQHRSNTKR